LLQKCYGAAFILAIVLTGCQARADTFTLEGTYTPNSVEPTIHTLSGTFEVEHGVFTAADISVSGFSQPFTLVTASLQNAFTKDWFLSATNPPNATGYAHVGFHIRPDFETYTLGFIGYQHGIITGGYLDSGTSFVQSDITGTFTCAETNGCERLPVPVPVAGTGLLNLLIGFGVLYWRRRPKNIASIIHRYLPC
jgi:hypothetical protein